MWAVCTGETVNFQDTRHAEQREASPGEAVARSANEQLPASMRHLRCRALRAGVLRFAQEDSGVYGTHQLGQTTQHDDLFIGLIHSSPNRTTS